MKILKILFLLLWVSLLTECRSQDKIKYKNDYKYDMNKPKKLYYLDYKLFLSYEIYFNDVKLKNNIQSGPVSGMAYLNEFLLDSGEQTVRLVDKDIYPDTNIPDNLFENMRMKIYTSDENEENIQELAVFPFPDTVVPRPYYFEKTWTFEAEVPFELEGWKNGQDLRLMDEKELEKMVVDKYEELRHMLQQGNISDIMTANKKGDEEFMISYYMDNKKWGFVSDNIVNLMKDQEGHMQPLENYKVVIQGNGKLVALERIDLPYMGESALFAIDEEETYYTNYIYLYMPQGKNTLEPIRYRIDYGLVGH